MVAFYGCLLAEVVPVPIEVPLSRKVLYEIHLIFYIEKVPPCHLAVCSLSVDMAAALQSLSFSFQFDTVPQDYFLCGRSGNLIFYSAAV